MGRRTLNLSFLGLFTAPPLNGICDLEFLDLSNNFLCSLDESHFLPNSALQVLDLSHNRFSEFTEKSFLNYPFLETLILDYNHFKKLENHFFHYLPILKKLSFVGNVIHSIEDGVFQKNNHIADLNLRDNCLYYFSQSNLTDLHSLEYLDLSHNLFQKFVWPIENRSSPIIFLLHNPILLLDAIVLHEQQFSDNYQGPIYEVSIHTDEYAQTQSTMPKVLFDQQPVCNTRLKGYFDCLFDWVSKDALTDFSNKKRVQYNIVQFLNQSIDNQCFFSLIQMNLYSIPPLSALVYSDKFSFSCNYISRFDFSSLPVSSKLRVLDLSYNSLTEIHPQQLSSASNLKELYLMMNEIHLIESGFSSNLPQLEILDLTTNRISEIHPDAFLNFKNLTVLTLRNNQIMSLQSQLFRNLSRVREIDLTSNLLTRFDWPSVNDACPQILLLQNQLSLDTTLRMNMAQNISTYRGPIFQFSIFLLSSISISTVSLNFFSDTLSLWGRDPSLAPWSVILEETVESMRDVYNNFNIFFLRLYNEVPRNYLGEISSGVLHHVAVIFSILEKYPSDLTLLRYCCDTAHNAISTCVDRIGIHLILMALYLKRYDAQKRDGVDDEKNLSFQIHFIQKIIKFVDDVHELKVVFDINSGSFLRLSDLAFNGIHIQGVSDLVLVDNVSKDDREALILDLNLKGYELRSFHVGDQVEDVLLIINHFNSNGIFDVDHVDMRFGACATLRDYLDSVRAFFLS